MLLPNSSAALDEQKRKDTKSQNTNGDPIRLQSKILAVQADPINPGAVFVAQSGGTVRKVILEVGAWYQPVSGLSLAALNTVAKPCVHCCSVVRRNSRRIQRTYRARHQHRF